VCDIPGIPSKHRGSLKLWQIYTIHQTIVSNYKLIDHIVKLGHHHSQSANNNKNLKN
jgi:hypothetical protein